MIQVSAVTSKSRTSVILLIIYGFIADFVLIFTSNLISLNLLFEQIREVRHEMTPYSGEPSGIRAGVKRGVRLKA